MFSTPPETVPGETVPGETVPGETVPGETVPGETPWKWVGLSLLVPGAGWLGVRGRPGRRGPGAWGWSRALGVLLVWAGLMGVAVCLSTYEVRLADAVRAAREPAAWANAEQWWRGLGSLFARPASAWLALAALALQLGAAWGAAQRQVPPGHRA